MKKKNIKREYGRNRYQNMWKEDKERLKEYKKVIVKKKNQHKYFLAIFSLLDIKMGQKVLIFGKEGIIKNLFHKSKRSISIDKVDTKKIVLSSKESYR